jgi:hypothetical protein
MTILSFPLETTNTYYYFVVIVFSHIQIVTMKNCVSVFLNTSVTCHFIAYSFVIHKDEPFTSHVFHIKNHIRVSHL